MFKCYRLWMRFSVAVQAHVGGKMDNQLWLEGCWMRGGGGEC